MKLPNDIEDYRVRDGVMASNPGKPYGCFLLPYKSHIFTVIAHDGEGTGWEHVSISLRNRTPNWTEMCHFKDIFWTKEETVVQFHPKASNYVNISPNCLHLWKCVGVEYDLPPEILV